MSVWINEGLVLHGIMRLWQDACAGETHFGDIAASEYVLAGHIVRRAHRLASHGCYGNALQALGSKGVAPLMVLLLRRNCCTAILKVYFLSILQMFLLLLLYSLRLFWRLCDHSKGYFPR